MPAMRFPPKVFTALLFCAAMLGLGGWWLAREDRAPESRGAGSEAPAPGAAARPLADPGAPGASVTGGTNTPAVPASAATAAAAPGSGLAPFPRIAVRPAAGQTAGAAPTLRPRTPLAKEPLVLPPGRVHQLTVKLADPLQARAGAQGELLVTAENAAAVAELARVAEEWDLRFRPMQTASEAALQRLQERAARRTGQAQPDLGGMLEAVLPQASPQRVLAAANALQALAEVEFATIRSIDAPPPPPADLSPPTPSLVGQQTYRKAASGIDVDYVWTTYGLRGAPGLRVTDCEYEFRRTHEDLAGLVTVQAINSTMYTGFGDDHGTAVLGILAAGDNGYGMDGSLPRCDTWFYPEYSNTIGGGFQSRPATVVAAIADSEEGDIVVLEMQDTGASGGFGPAEYDLALWTAVKAGTDAGVSVVAAAGNGAEDLNSAAYLAYRNRGDSGAILVGAGSSARARLSFSTSGTRVNLQGWGGGVASTGYGSLATYGGDLNQKYTASFSGTSSATPIVASAVGLLQTVAIEILERRLSPAEIRNLLVSTGRPQTGDLARRIGPLPNLAAAVQQLLAASPPVLTTLRSWGFYEFATATPALLADDDRNGLENLLEYVLGSDPNAEPPSDRTLLPRLTVTPGPGANRTVRYEFNNPPGRSGAGWQVEASPTMQPASWQPLVAGQGGVSITRMGSTVRVEMVESPLSATRFLRLRASVP